jgi:hypothetical protein
VAQLVPGAAHRDPLVQVRVRDPIRGGGDRPQRREHARVVAALAFAKCMRDHGFPGFPDPTAQGELTPEMVSAAGIDLHQRALLQAGLSCVPVSHGLITRAAVQRAVSG